MCYIKSNPCKPPAEDKYLDDRDLDGIVDFVYSLAPAIPIMHLVA